jgi:hypothetical protein
MSMALSAPARTETLPALASVPSLSGSLAYYVGGDTVIDGDLHPVHGSPGPGDVAEARRVLPQVQHLCRPPSIALIAAWCRKISPHLPRAPLDEQAVLLAVQGSLWPAATCPTRCGRGEGDAARYTCLRDGLARVIAAANTGRTANRAAAQARGPDAGGG